MRIAVAITTYNSPKYLELVVWGYALQTHRDFELVIADDGSTPETARCIRDLQRETGLSIQHVWHPDCGFRKCTILNRAVEATDADYLIFSDGDCIPRADFLAQHARLAEPGRFLSGGMVRLPAGISGAIEIDDVQRGRATDAKWLRRQGLRLGHRRGRLSNSPPLAACLDRFTPTSATWNGHNASGWREDIVSVNGFDERMEYGGLDRELGERLVNFGIRPVQIRYRAVCIHLYHERGYVRDEALAVNREIRQRTRSERRDWTNFGMRRSQHLQPFPGSRADPERPLPETDRPALRRAA